MTHAASSTSSSSSSFASSSLLRRSSSFLLLPVSLSLLLLLVLLPSPALSEPQTETWPSNDQQYVCSEICIASGQPLEVCCMLQSELDGSVSSEASKRNNQGYMPFRYGKRQMPFRYGKRSAGLPPQPESESSESSGSLWKRQFRYGKRRLLSALSPSSLLSSSSSSSSDGGVDKRQFRYGKRSLTSFDDQSESAYHPLPSMAEDQQ